MLNKPEKSSHWLQWLKHLLHLDPQTKSQLTDVLREAQIRELIDAETLAMLEGALAFAELKVRDIMLPKKQMICIESNAGLAEIIPVVTQSGHSRFPVMNDKNEEIIGILHAKDLLRYQNFIPEDFDLNDIVRRAPVVPESKRLDSLLHDFRSHRNHMAIVVDEYGSILGFVTLEDIIEQIIGDIEDEFDIDEEANIKTHANGHYIIKSHTPIKEFNAEVHAQLNDKFYDTLGGILMANFGYLPKPGEIIEIEQFEFKIISADARRIHLIECFDHRDIATPSAQED